jgi:hypothetical protein
MTAVHLSIHDVMPTTLKPVAALIRMCQAHGWPPPTLLVVPGLAWDKAGIRQLQAWQTAGHELAGHGWRHRISAYGGLYHRLHGLFISRDVAEHLSLEADGILDLMRRCHRWFGQQGLEAPTLYVPPAWALGPVPRARLGEQPFRRIETLRGIDDLDTGRRGFRGLLGYEAGNPLQRAALLINNAINRKRAPRVGLRIGLHPQDTQLPLAGALEQDLARFRPPRAGG